MKRTLTDIKDLPDNSLTDQPELPPLRDWESKWARLVQVVAKFPDALVAFSGGADSALVVKAAQMALPADRVLAVIADSVTFPDNERESAVEFLLALGVNYHILFIDELNNPEFVQNTTTRCYTCRKGLYSGMTEFAITSGFSTMMEGSNLDDDGDYRPGTTAITEMGIVSPLKLAGFTKSDVRLVSKELGLSTWDKPSMACVSSRIPHGNPITQTRIDRIMKSESYLRSLGIRQARVRDHNTIARIEVDRTDFPIMVSKFDPSVVQSFGFQFVTLDLMGYRTGSLNPHGSP